MKTITLSLLCFCLFSITTFAQSPYTLKKGTTFVEGTGRFSFNNSKQFAGTGVDQDGSQYNYQLSGTITQMLNKKFGIGVRVNGGYNKSTNSGPSEFNNIQVSGGLSLLLRRFYPITDNKRLVLFGQLRAGSSISQSTNQRFNGGPIDERIGKTFTPVLLEAQLGVMFRILPRLAITKEVNLLNYSYRLTKSERDGIETNKSFRHSLSANPSIGNIFQFNIIYFFKL